MSYLILSHISVIYIDVFVSYLILSHISVTYIDVFVSYLILSHISVIYIDVFVSYLILSHISVIYIDVFVSYLILSHTTQEHFKYVNTECVCLNRIIIHVVIMQEIQKPPAGQVQNLSNNWCFVDCKFIH